MAAQKRLLSEKDHTLARAVEIAIAMESAEWNAQEFREKAAPEKEVEAIVGIKKKVNCFQLDEGGMAPKNVILRKLRSTSVGRLGILQQFVVARKIWRWATQVSTKLAHKGMSKQGGWTIQGRVILHWKKALMLSVKLQLMQEGKRSKG